MPDYGGIMKQYNVTGMSCAACSARVEKAVTKVKGVTGCSVSLLTNSMGVEGTANPADVIAAVTAAGYGCTEKGAATSQSSSQAAAEEALKDKETPLLKKRLIWSVIFLTILMYFSMGVKMWNWPYPSFMAVTAEDGEVIFNPMMVALIEMLFTIIVMVINKKFFINGFKSLWHRSPNMDTLIALGSTAAFVYSTEQVFEMPMLPRSRYRSGRPQRRKRSRSYRRKYPCG